MTYFEASSTSMRRESCLRWRASLFINSVTSTSFWAMKQNIKIIKTKVHHSFSKTKEDTHNFIWDMNCESTNQIENPCFSKEN